MKYNREYARFLRGHGHGHGYPYGRPPGWACRASWWYHNARADFDSYHKVFPVIFNLKPHHIENMNRYISEVLAKVYEQPYFDDPGLWCKLHDDFEMTYFGDEDITWWFRKWRRRLMYHTRKAIDWSDATRQVNANIRAGNRADFAKYQGLQDQARSQAETEPEIEAEAAAEVEGWEGWLIDQLDALEQVRDLRPVDVARTLRISRAYYSLIKSGKRPLTRNLRRLLIRRFGLDKSYFDPS